MDRYEIDPRYPAPAPQPERIPIALWQLLGMFILFIAVLWWVA